MYTTLWDWSGDVLKLGR